MSEKQKLNALASIINVKLKITTQTAQKFDFNQKKKLHAKQIQLRTSFSEKLKNKEKRK